MPGCESSIPDNNEDTTARIANRSRGVAKILVVDDEPAITIALAKKLRRDGYECVTASSGEEALGRLASDSLDLVISDVRMPGMSGIELLKEIKGRNASVSVIVMSAYTDINFAIEALRGRADDFLLKPFNLDDFSVSVARALENRRPLTDGSAQAGTTLQIPRDGAASAELLSRQAIAALAAAVESRDGRPHEHQSRVVRCALAMGTALGLGKEALRGVWLGAVLHDVGMLSVPEAVLSKAGGLSPDDWGLIQHHPSSGARIVTGVEFLEPALSGILHHHERWDGSGYPACLSGEQISIEGRVVAVADAFAAMLSERPYRGARSESEAVRELEHCAGAQFDMTVVKAFQTARAKGYPVGDSELASPDWLAE